MKARPILFSGPMVRAILDGRKTQTRRIVKPQPYFDERHGVYAWDKSKRHAVMANGSPTTEASLRRMLPRLSPYGKPGDVLWVRESFSGPYKLSELRPGDWPPHQPPIWDTPVWYWADGNPERGDWTRPRPPRWASRITLEIESIRVERLQDISEADARAEGIDYPTFAGRQPDDLPDLAPSDIFADLWESINGPGSWAANSWVWVISFRPHLMNVDEFLKQREAA